MLAICCFPAQVEANMPVHPEIFGRKWNPQLVINRSSPKLIKGNTFGG
jgi:hypothetical protein